MHPTGGAGSAWFFLTGVVQGVAPPPSLVVDEHSPLNGLRALTSVVLRSWCEIGRPNICAVRVGGPLGSLISERANSTWGLPRTAPPIVKLKSCALVRSPVVDDRLAPRRIHQLTAVTLYCIVSSRRQGYTLSQ